MGRSRGAPPRPALIGPGRVAGSLPVLRWAFAGALIAVLADFSDLFQKDFIGLGGVGDYK